MREMDDVVATPLFFRPHRTVVIDANSPITGIMYIIIEYTIDSHQAPDHPSKLISTIIIQSNGVATPIAEIMCNAFSFVTCSKVIYNSSQ